MKRSWIAVAVMVLGSLVLVACSEEAPIASEPNGSAAPQAPEPDGRIVFMRGDPSEGVLAGEGITYIVSADGTSLRKVTGAPDVQGQHPDWAAPSD